MTTTNPSSDYFEKVASQWDDLRAGYFTEAVREVAIRKAYLHPEMTVADVGAGTGFIAAGLAPLVKHVHVLDGSPAMLEVARRAAKKGGYTNVKFRHGYAEKLPVKDGEIDVIISNCVINLAEDKAKVFAEAYRVLKTGGRLEVNDVVFSGAVLPEARLSALGWSECVSGALPEAEYVDLVKQAGFKDIRVRRSTSSGVSNDVSVYSVQVSARKLVSVDKE